MRDLDKQLIEEEMERVECNYAEELELTFDYITELFKVWKISEYTNHFYDLECPKHYCEDDCEECEIRKDFKGSYEQLSYNNWIDVWGKGIWGESQQIVDNRAYHILLDIMEDDDLEYRLWTFERDGYKYIYYYNRDRFSDNWFIFERRN